VIKLNLDTFFHQLEAVTALDEIHGLTISITSCITGLAQTVNNTVLERTPPIGYSAMSTKNICGSIRSQGYSIPLRGPNGQFAVFSVSHNCNDDIWEAFTIEHQRDLILIAYYLNQKALELEKTRVPEATRHLSPREVDAHFRAHAAGLYRKCAVQTWRIEHDPRGGQGAGRWPYRRGRCCTASERRLARP